MRFQLVQIIVMQPTTTTTMAEMIMMIMMMISIVLQLGSSQSAKLASPAQVSQAEPDRSMQVFSHNMTLKVFT